MPARPSPIASDRPPIPPPTIRILRGAFIRCATFALLPRAAVHRRPAIYRGGLAHCQENFFPEGIMPLRQDRDCARPAGGGAMDLDREAHDFKSVGRQNFEIVQLLKMRIADLAAGAVTFPDQADV